MTIVVTHYGRAVDFPQQVGVPLAGGRATDGVVRVGTGRRQMIAWSHAEREFTARHRATFAGGLA
jgi:hypothetical protein